MPASAAPAVGNQFDTVITACCYLSLQVQRLAATAGLWLWMWKTSPSGSLRLWLALQGAGCEPSARCVMRCWRNSED